VRPGKAWCCALPLPAAAASDRRICTWLRRHLALQQEAHGTMEFHLSCICETLILRKELACWCVWFSSASTSLEGLHMQNATSEQ
jgi:hypothetical protein